MNTPEIQAFTPRGGEFELAHPTVLEVSRSLDSPAQSFSGSFALAGLPEEWERISLRHRGRELFSGELDRQEAVLGVNGVLVTAEARSKAAALLDNEAAPGVLANVGLGTVFANHIAPYGFVCVNPNPPGRLPLFAIHKGMSEWEALCAFVMRVYGVTPQVEGEQVYVGLPSGEPMLRFSNTGEGIRFSRLKKTATRYNVISRVVVRDKNGQYSAGVSNPAADALGVRRRRYMIPAGEFADDPGLGANQRIWRSMLEKDSAALILPGFVQARPGQRACVVDKALTLYNQLVREVTWRWDKTGETTELRLCGQTYYR